MRDYFNGSFGPGNYPTLLFYDPNDIADVVAGAKETWEPVWHARKNLAHYYFGRDLQKPMGGDESIEDMRDAQAAGGLAFDRERGKLYVAQRRGPDYQTFIHVFQIDTSVSVSTQACAAIPVFGNLAAYPNPFNAEVSIAVSFREHGLVSGIESLPLSIYNIKGQCVCRTLPLRNRMDKNSVHYVWHASGYPSGIYIIEVCQKGRRTTAFVTLVK
ncbi:MAG: hypothetical protein A2350_08155 [Candidatus Raymondbacteria bacterium RifOxyB12_full_50_8]|nr:MAG: hypothetical protein A2350_08155 [Candidatus Raymondbacteria bacterium RifOxyB12_full_50_8]